MYQSFASPLHASKKKYMAQNASGSGSPFPSFCTVCDTELDSTESNLYCSDECRKKDFVPSKLPSFELLSRQPSTDHLARLDMMRPPSPATSMHTDSTRNSINSFDLNSRASTASLFSTSLLSRRKLSDAVYSTTTCSPLPSPMPDDEFDLGGDNNTLLANSHRISAPVLGAAPGSNSPFLGPRVRRQSFYVRAGSHVYSNSLHDSIDIPASKQRTSVASMSNLYTVPSLISESPRSIHLVMPNTPAEAPAPELEYDFPKIEKSDGNKQQDSRSTKKLFY